MIKTNCNFCKKEFKIFEYRLKRSKFVYCSKKCKNNDASNLMLEAHKNKNFGFGISSIGGFPKGKKNPKLSNIKKRLIGKLNPFYGKKHSNKTKENIRNSKLGKKQSQETIKKRIKSCCEFYDEKGRKTSFNELLRHNSKWKIWREAIFLRDNFTCQNENCKFCNNKMGIFLHPHHIKSVSLFPELIFNIENGITYCAEFHLKSGLHKNMKMEIEN